MFSVLGNLVVNGDFEEVRGSGGNVVINAGSTWFGWTQTGSTGELFGDYNSYKCASGKQCYHLHGGCTSTSKRLNDMKNHKIVNFCDRSGRHLSGHPDRGWANLCANLLGDWRYLGRR